VNDLMRSVGFEGEMVAAVEECAVCMSNSPFGGSDPPSLDLSSQPENFIP
jgi:hypothetical protein